MTRFADVEIPYGAYWSTPFAKWQGALQHLHSVRLAAHVAKSELAKRQIETAQFDFGVLGITQVQYQSFQGAIWPLYEIGMTHVAGPQLSQVCSTGPRIVLTAAAEIQLGMATTALVLGADRTSNGAHIYYPAPAGFGGMGQSEDQVTYNFSHDVNGGHSMLQTAENVAKKYGVSTQEQHDVVLRRYEQYQQALKDDQAFQRRYMTLPFSVPKYNFKGEAGVLTADEGVFPTSVEGLARLKPVLPGGTVTFGSQTHPADGNCGMVITTPEKARQLSRDPSIRVRILGFGQARADLAHMPEAPVPATKRALENAGVSIRDIKAVKSHNPFAVNDIVFAREMGFPLEKMNNYGCSLVWGHPHAATGLRAIIELIEELALQGGGVGLFQGCAAGDSSMAAVIAVDDRSSK
ncbi:acetyl-CoA acetyltransferase family protein [Povalibacter uvarum]|uniref:Acetyl-CoA acetyltransferase family protein n=1 Tax=Povalibacter uvarum TaxID=732238 RepID=A0A841HN96_9GAMM|nr:thiolase family protein [Povalibacter uvarum]MBB6093819.1 acetyl-CoA acetyltransferase family protein [Povalibacter uvarum]